MCHDTGLQSLKQNQRLHGLDSAKVFLHGLKSDKRNLEQRRLGEIGQASQAGNSGREERISLGQVLRCLIVLVRSVTKKELRWR